MLILGRKEGQKIIISHKIKIVVIQLTEHYVRLGVDAPSGSSVNREEIEIAKILSKRKNYP